MALPPGVGRCLSKARAITNVIGNDLATLGVAESKDEFDKARYSLASQGQ